MERYVEYKDSGVTWVGSVPAHWKVAAIKRCCSDIWSGTTPDTANLDYYDYNGSDESINWIQSGDLYGETEVRSTAKSVLPIAVKKLSTLKVGKADFIVVAMYGASVGNTAISKIDACCNQACCCIKPKTDTSMKYLFYWLDACKTDLMLQAAGGGQPNINQVKLKNEVFLIPPTTEQIDIAAYLDRRTAQIDTLIADLQSQAEMLDRYKRELIAEAVTKGLNKSATMKDSGVDYIGEIPQHWNIVPLRAYLKVLSIKNNPDLPLLSVEREKGVVDRETEGSENNHNRIPDDLTNYKVVRAGQFVMNKMKAWRGSYGVSAYDGIVSPAYYVFDLNFPNPTFFNYAIRSTKYIGFFGRDSYGIRTDQWDFKIGAIKDIPLAVPPVGEQQAIVEYLDHKIPLIDGLLTDITAQIEKLKQYRQIVIHDAVTGKMKVTEG